MPRPPIKKETPKITNRDQLFMSMDRMLKRVLIALLPYGSSNGQLIGDIRALRGLTEPEVNRILEKKKPEPPRAEPTEEPVEGEVETIH